jgi:hypothetical protein
MFKVYMSHPIRGSLKDKATQDTMNANCELAKGIAGKIRQYVEFHYAEAGLDLYVPAEHEAFVSRAWKQGMLKVHQILDLDCLIIKEEYNNLLLVFAPYGPPVEGCHVEMTHARVNFIPVIIFKDMSEFKEKFEAFVELGGLG